MTLAARAVRLCLCVFVTALTAGMLAGCGVEEEEPSAPYTDEEEAPSAPYTDEEEEPSAPYTEKEETTGETGGGLADQLPGVWELIRIENEPEGHDETIEELYEFGADGNYTVRWPDKGQQRYGQWRVTDEVLETKPTLMDWREQEVSIRDTTLYWGSGTPDLPRVEVYEKIEDWD